MSYGKAPLLTETMVRYPFSRRSRSFFEELPIEESLASSAVLKQAERRLLSCLGRSRYEPNMTEEIEFLSFFAAALVAAQDQNLAEKLSFEEGERAKRFFVVEKTGDKMKLTVDCFGLNMIQMSGGVPGEGDAYEFLVPVEEYLRLTTRLELNRIPRWKLVNQALSNGLVYFTENVMNDFFGDLARWSIYDGIRNLKKAAFPRELGAMRDSLVQYLPAPKPRSTRGYLYVEELLKSPVSDGRHRLTWLVLAPYLLNVKKLDEKEASEIIHAFVAAKGETQEMKRFIEYNVRRAKRNGLMPPSLNKLKLEHPDIYALLPVGTTKEAKGRK